MIMALVQFPLAHPVSLEEATEMFEGSAPKYKDLPGLKRKHYLRSEDGKTVGGAYFWESRAAAEAVYNENWIAFVTDKYGAPPVIAYFDNPVIIDNS